MAEDISKTTVMVLLVLTILISVLGTWTVLDAMSAKRVAPTEAPVEGPSTSTASVQLNIQRPPEPQKSGPTTGMAILNIVKGGE